MVDLIEQIEDAYTDNCTGAVTVTFLSASDLDACSDTDGDGVFTFGRTFYFQVTDVCGNETLCDVSYTGSCQAFCTYTQGAYGSAGGNHSNGMNTTETLDILLESGPIVIGEGTCGFEVSTTACVLGILPAGGPSVPLDEDYVLDCTETIDNTLVGQLLTLQLNLLYNLEFNDGLDLGAVDLTCLFPAGQIDDLGLTSSSTVNDLIALANEFLGSNCNGNTYPNGFGGDLTSALGALNERWDECQQTDPCTGEIVDPGANSGSGSGALEALRIYPNPAITLVNVEFIAKAKSTSRIRLFNSEGRFIKEFETDIKEGENKILIDVSQFAAGVYWMDMTNTEFKLTERLVIIRQ